jgi:taurine dioxygenase/sulfonate dioxygenase
MAPSIAEERPHKVDIVVPVKAPPTTTEKPKIRRIIDEEGGTTTASVRFYLSLLSLF